MQIKQCRSLMIKVAALFYLHFKSGKIGHPIQEAEAV